MNYTAYEKTENLPGSVSATLSSVNFTVTVTDNGDGTLTAVTNYPDGGIVFKNVILHRRPNQDVNKRH